jgi:hypothetical protein
MRLAASTTLCVALLIAGAATVSGNVPDPLMSTFGNDVGRSPRNVAQGDPTFYFTFEGFLLNSNGNPVVNWDRNDVLLRIVAPCPNPADLKPIANSDGAGRVFWDHTVMNQGGGACLGSPSAAPAVRIEIPSIGLFKTLLQVVSPDINGDGIISAQDLSLFQQSFPPNPVQDHICDFNFDNVCSAQDLSWLQNHFF